MKYNSKYKNVNHHTSKKKFVYYLALDFFTSMTESSQVTESYFDPLPPPPKYK